MVVPQKVNLDLSCDPTTPFLGIYTKEIKSIHQRDIGMPLFITAVFTIAKIWKQLRYPSANEWIKEMCHIHIKNVTQL
jgi:hypothetical protein